MSLSSEAKAEIIAEHARGDKGGGKKKGAAAASKYKDGTAIMVLPLKGAMAEAAGGGQKFKFEPVGE